MSPTPPTPPAVLPALAARTTLVDETKALLAGFIPQLGGVEREIADVQTALTTAILATSDDAQRRDLELLGNRASSALRAARQISAEVLELARLVTDLVRDAQAAHAAAVTRAAPPEGA